MKTAEEILCQFRIIPTEQRLSLMKLILELEKSPFSVQDLNDGMRAINIVVSHNTLVTTLLLLVTRKVLLAFPAPKTGKKKGRPVKLYVVDPSLSFIPTSTETAAPTGKAEDVKALDFPLNEQTSVKNNPDNF